MSQLSHRLESQAEGQMLYLSGDVDEYADFSKIKIVSSSQLTIDLSQVHHVNSMGIKLWVNWVRTLPKFAAAICFRHCQRAVVQQINVLKGFLPASSIVESVVVPFYCETCEEESEYLAHRGEDYFEQTADQEARIAMPLTRKCETCGDIEEADIMQASYFKFLRAT